MIDLSSIKNYYIACGYTDLRRGIDGLAQIVTLQYGYEINENSLFLFCGRRTRKHYALERGDEAIHTKQNKIRNRIIEAYVLTPPQKKSGGVMFMGRLLSGYYIHANPLLICRGFALCQGVIIKR